MEEQTIISGSEKVKLRVPGQNWVVLNIFGPGLRQVTDQTSIRILGVFDTEEEANAHAEHYRKLDDRFDIYVFKMYEIGAIPNHPHDVGNVNYTDPRMNELMAAHESSKTTTEAWNERVERAKLTGKDQWESV